LLVQPSLTAVFAAANASGVAWLEVAIPWRTALRGLPVFWQAAALEAGGPLGGLSLANGRRTVLGD
jgi:hypothetical protein